jgi:hypothetical protein
MPGIPWTVIFLFILATMTRMIGAHHHTQPYVELEYGELFSQADFEP